MKKLLHIISTPREDESRTLQVTDAFIGPFKESHSDWVIDELNLWKETLPPLTRKRVDGKYILLAGKDLHGDLKDTWEEIVAQIERFLSADAYLISTPMWNFGIPYVLKHYIDIIIQPKYLFRYTQTGVEGLAKNKKMIVISSRGGEYITEQMRTHDMQEPYLRLIFGFVGINDITFIKAEPMDMGPELERKGIMEAQERAREIAAKFQLQPTSQR
jgi:FMN-dependent NADH-azoreductase